MVWWSGERASALVRVRPKNYISYQPMLTPRLLITSCYRLRRCWQPVKSFGLGQLGDPGFNHVQVFAKVFPARYPVKRGELATPPFLLLTPPFLSAPGKWGIELTSKDERRIAHYQQTLAVAVMGKE